MNKIKKLTLISLIVVLAILLIVVLIGSLLKTHKPVFLYQLFVSQETAPYYMVYVNTGTTGTSYYGQIAKEEREFLILKNPGYLDVQAAAKEGEQPQVSFRQVKDDPLKPLPEMKIYKNNIIFVQELSADSPVIQAYKTPNNL